MIVILSDSVAEIGIKSIFSIFKSVIFSRYSFLIFSKYFDHNLLNPFY